MLARLLFLIIGIFPAVYLVYSFELVVSFLTLRLGLVCSWGMSGKQGDQFKRDLHM